MKRPFPWPIEMSEWYLSGMTCQEISDMLSSDEWQPYWAERLGRPYQPSQKVVNKRLRTMGITRPRGAPLERNGFWKGGRTITKDGYVQIRVERGVRMLEHRHVMQQKLGRPLHPDEVVHHIDGNKKNNHPDNLQLFASQADHVSQGHRHGDSSRNQVAIQTRKQYLLMGTKNGRKPTPDDVALLGKTLPSTE